MTRIFLLSLPCVQGALKDPSAFNLIENEKLRDTGPNKKLLYCAFQKNKVVSAEGKINVDKLIQIFPDGKNKEKIVLAIKECSNDDEGSPEDRVFHLVQCFYEKGLKYVKIPI